MMEPLGDLLRELRRQRGLSQDAVARLAGVSGAHLSRIEAGRVRCGDGYCEANHPAIIAPDFWEQVQRLRSLRHRNRQCRREWLLSSILRCWRCGGPMVASYRRAGVAQYVCSRYQTARSCRGSRVPARRVEQDVIAALDALARREDPRTQITSAPSDSDRHMADALAAELAELPARRERIEDLAERGLLAPERFAKRLDRLNTEQERLRVALAGLVAAEVTAPQVDCRLTFPAKT